MANKKKGHKAPFHPRARGHKGHASMLRGHKASLNLSKISAIHALDTPAHGQHIITARDINHYMR